MRVPGHPSHGRRQARFGGSFLASDLRRSGGRFGAGSALGRQQASGASHIGGLAPLTPAAPASGYSQEQRNAERAKLYESALQKSIATAGHPGGAHRRSVSGGGAGTEPSFQTKEQDLDEDDLRSNLEDSYIDGTTRRAGGMDNERDEEQELADGGVMGLLAQIYDNRRRGI